MNAIEIKKLNKTLGNFKLNIENLEVKKGYITGFIGPNGAGKTSTIKAILGMINSNPGDITIFDKDLNDLDIKEKIGAVLDVSGFLEELKVKAIKKNIKRFYKNWDEELYLHLINKFKIDENNNYGKLSKGQMKLFDLALALAKKPKLLIMDEPTASLDPVIRAEFLDIIQEEMTKGDFTVFYSTHVTTDLDKCADYIILLSNGEILLKEEKDKLLEEHILVKGKIELLDSDTRKVFISIKESEFGFVGLSNNKKLAEEVFGQEVIYNKPNLEDLMVYYNRRN